MNRFWKNTIIYILFNILVLILGFIGMTSCTTTKSIQKYKSDEKTEIKTVETTTTTSVTQGTLETKEEVKEASEPIIDLENGKDLVIEDSKVKTTVHFDKKTGKVSEKTVEKALVIPVSTTLTAIESRTTTSKKEVKGKFKNVEIKRSWWNWWYLLIVAALVLGWWVKKRWF